MGSGIGFVDIARADIFVPIRALLVGIYMHGLRARVSLDNRFH